MVDINDFRPFASDSQDIVFNTALNFRTDADEDFDVTEKSDVLTTFMQSLSNQQPSIDFASAEVVVLDNPFYLLSNGATTTRREGRDVVGAQWSVEIDARLEEPIVVFSHVEDAQFEVEQNNFSNVMAGDSRILPQGELRDQRDNQMERGDIKETLPANQFL